MHKTAMAGLLDQERLQVLILKLGLNDRELADKLGVSQPTVWRLRNGKISKINKYMEKVEALVTAAGGGPSGLGLADLVGLAERSPALRRALEALLQLMHESA